MTIPEELPRSCRYCAYMICGGINYCDLKGISVSDAQLPVVRKCHHWLGSSMAADTGEEWVPKPEPKPKHCEGQMKMEVTDGD